MECRRTAIRFALIWSLAIGCLPCAGCATVYGVKQGWIHLKRLSSSMPIRSFIEDPSVNSKYREKAKLVLRARGFGVERLALKATKDFSHVVKIKGRAVAYVVFACRKDRLEPHVWRVPLIGSFPYKGFFRFKDAQKEASRWRKRGFDTHVAPVAAFSTLGWFCDPLYTPMLAMDEVDLVNTVLHEMAHRTVFFPKRPQFNEQFATFVGWIGAVKFMSMEHGPRSPQARHAIHSLEDEKLFSRFIDWAHRKMQSFYKAPIPLRGKLALRAAAFEEIRKRLLVWMPKFHTGRFVQLAEARWNNALLYSLWLYRFDIGGLQCTYELLGSDLKALVKTVVLWKREGLDPKQMMSLCQRLSPQAPSNVCLSLLANQPSGSSK